MKKEKVRCWKVGQENELFITYPENDFGHRLICCKSCGMIYSVNITKQLYIEPNLDKHLYEVNCLKCSNKLTKNWFFYPDNYIDENGQICSFKRPFQIPNDEDSIVVEFPEIFS